MGSHKERVTQSFVGWENSPPSWTLKPSNADRIAGWSSPDGPRLKGIKRYLCWTAGSSVPVSLSLYFLGFLYCSQLKRNIKHNIRCPRAGVGGSSTWSAPHTLWMVSFSFWNSPSGANHFIIGWRGSLLYWSAVTMPPTLRGDKWIQIFKKFKYTVIGFFFLVHTQIN